MHENLSVLIENYIQGTKLPLLLEGPTQEKESLISSTGYNQVEELLGSTINLMNNETPSPSETLVDPGSPMNVDSPNESIPESQGSNEEEDRCGCSHDGNSHDNSSCDHSTIKSLDLQDHNESVCCICGVKGANCACAEANCVCEMHEDCLETINNSGEQVITSNSQNNN
jgi:hypothetical protein